MKTFQIYKTVSIEYFVQAESEDEALEKIDAGLVLSEDEAELSMTVSDVHDGVQWESEVKE